MRARRGAAAPVRPPVTPRRAVPPGPTPRDILDNFAQGTVSRRRLGAGAPRGNPQKRCIWIATAVVNGTRTFDSPTRNWSTLATVATQFSSLQAKTRNQVSSISPR